jgi:uncharacterized membrane-anchored protein
MKSHPLQQSLIAELHNRPFPRLKAPVCISHMVIVEPADLSAELEHIRVLAQRYSVASPSDNATCYYQDFGQFEFRWERHTEFSSYMVIVPILGDKPFTKTALALLPTDWLDQLGGAMISGDHIEMREGMAQCPSPEELHPYFEGQRLFASVVQDGKATLRTAVRAHQDNFGRIIIYTDSGDVCESGRLARSMMELTAYRTLTLLALPIARNLIPAVSAMEYTLAGITDRITDIKTFNDEKKLLGELSEFAASLEQLISDNSFRFAATEAYYQLTQDRLEELKETNVPNLITLQQFYHRRFRPGFSTCQSVKNRMQSLSDRVDRASNMLRTRVDLSLESQNQNLLRSMDNRAKLQLRMQQTVEGLSIVAISHYILSLFNHVLKGIPATELPVSASAIVAIATPVVLLMAWLSVRRIRKQFALAEDETSY